MPPSISIVTISPKTSAAQPITDFAAVRNKMLAQAKSDWVLFLDSDEKIHKTDFEMLKKHIADTKASGLFLRRSDIFYGKQLGHGEWGRVNILRAMRRDAARYHGKVHEVPQISGSTETTTVAILHNTHPSVSAFITKVSRYAALAAAEKNVSITRTGVEIFIYPLTKFVLNYFIRLGLLDGWRGLAYATTMSLHSFFVRAFRISYYLQK